MYKGFTRVGRLTLFCLLIFLFGSTFSRRLSAQCTLACNNQVNLALDLDCMEEITADLMLESNPANCNPPDYIVTVYQPNGLSPIPTSPVVTSLQIGQTLPVKVAHPATGQNCWSTLQVNDNLPPQMTCPPSVTISCNEPYTPFDTGVPSITDCQGYTQNYYDQFIDLGCNDPTGYYLRTWTATDSDGNFNSCQQTIYLSSIDLDLIEFPADRDGMDAPVIDCANPNTDPSNTGLPLIEGNPVPEGGVCQLTVFFSDLEVAGCGSTYAVLRTWSVLEWCTGTVAQHTQVIVVDDTLGPTVIIPDTLIAYTNDPLVCNADVTFPPAQLSDNCADSFSVQILTPFGAITGNGGTLNDIPLGIHTVTYQASDPCANVTNQTTVLQIIDNMPPIAICDQITSVSLGPFGTTMVFAETFDDGSFDNCCGIDLDIRRLDGLCGQSQVFANSVTFCCEDVGTTVDVELRAMDCFGNANYCDVIVLVSDQLDPEITCPVNVTISCSADPLDLNLTGEPYVFDGCGVDSVGYADVEDLNDCGVGTINRTWVVFDSLGNTASCTQLITLEDQTPLVITFPPDLELAGCFSVEDLDPEDLDAPYDSPNVENDDCELVATNISDEVFTVTPDACLKIVRTWTLIDWCVYEPNNSNSPGVYVGVQVIKVIDNEPPGITCPPDQLVEITGTDCFTEVLLPQPDVDDCDTATELNIVSDFGSGAGPFTEVEPGTYSATYFATDGCNNTSNCGITIEVIDAKLPTAYCQSGAVITLMPIDTTGDGQADIGQIDLVASGLDLGSFDNCDPSPQLSFSVDVSDTIQTFSCDQLGLNMIELWVTDQSGNQDFCQTSIIIQDNIGVCNGGMLPVVAGIITDELGQPLEQVSVDISDVSQPTQWTESDGLYEFTDLVLGLDYSVSPAKDTAVRNGLTTLDLAFITRHILGIEYLDSPYKIIAADADLSGTISTVDVVALRQIILFLTDDLPNGNTSWRFVPADYQFQNPANPLLENFPEVININNLEEDLIAADFMGIKVGDVNNSALPDGLTTPSQRTTQPEMLLRTCSEEVQAGEEFTLLIYPGENVRISGIQGSFSFDPSRVQMLQMEAPQLPQWQNGNSGIPLSEPGNLTFSWNAPEDQMVSSDEPLFVLKGIALQSGNPADFIHGGDLLRPEWYSDGGEVFGWTLQYEACEVVMSVRPNLVKKEVEICIQGAAGSELVVISDLNGRLVRNLLIDGCASLSADILPQPGMYLVSVPERGIVKRIVKVNP